MMTPGRRAIVAADARVQFAVAAIGMHKHPATDGCRMALFSAAAIDGFHIGRRANGTKLEYSKRVCIWLAGSAYLPSVATSTAVFFSIFPGIP
ncbi:hypothetical protein IC762_11650 [Bradyrhizobium genosp. L]|uniref:hypothetical protein n=1 Tax=Bradyrhizobium genosp. L TaxID=83637 RepID=UPI0018A29982|nr:hypothetical protein [Bradyrhizobium genosp. L]QPF86899.1 hypothetical protein IC762_11650 [Bradyrhizobium genosp. L]